MKAFLKWLKRPYVRWKSIQVKRSDGRVVWWYWYVGLVWELHIPGYYQLWYDGPIHHFSFGVVSVYWHESA